MAKKGGGRKSNSDISGKRDYVVPLGKPANRPLLSGVVHLATGAVEESEEPDEIPTELLKNLTARYKSLFDETIELLGLEGAKKFVVTATAFVFESEEEISQILAKSLQELMEVAEPALEVYRWKITLVDAPYRITRTIDVPDCSLGYLHEVLQLVMGWTDSHLHTFESDKEFYGPELEDDGGMPVEWKDECAVLTSELIGPSKKKTLSYVYDFGDSWTHRIELIGRTAVGRRPSCAVCVEGVGAGPPEDVGGVWGFGEILDRLASDNLDEEDPLEPSFDPKKFDLAKLNRQLKKLKWQDYH